MTAARLILVDPQPSYIESSGRWCWPLPEHARFPECCTEVVTASREWWEYAPSEAKPHPMAEGVMLRDEQWYWAVPDDSDTLLASLRAANAEQRAVIERLTRPEPRRTESGSWPQRCEQRAFVNGATWARFVITGFTAFPSERDEAEAEAVKRYGEPAAPSTAAIVSPRLCSKTACAGDVADFVRDQDEMGGQR